METNLSCVSSLKEEVSPVYIQPHYRESYRLAIYALLCGGRETYEEFLKVEKISHFLSEDEIHFILENAELPVLGDDSEAKHISEEQTPSTYFPTESDEEVPDLDLGWPEVALDDVDTSISLLFHPPRQNTPSIKDVVRRQIKDARQVIAIAMDVFTDVDIFKEIISAALRGVVVYILLDDFQYCSFMLMSERLGVKILDIKNIRVRTVKGQQYQCRSGAKFHGALEQRFILVDCRTVLYGTYSYTWSYEKINLSMVLVITGQLVASYDEEFRRLYARSTVPVEVCQDRRALRHPTLIYSPNASRLSLNLIYPRVGGTNGLLSSKDGRYNPAALTKGLSMQDRLHQAHQPEIGKLVKGNSYGGELQRLNSMTCLRNGTRLRGNEDLPLTSRLSQLQQQKKSRFPSDQHLLPYNSETSLHRWKIESYFSNDETPVDTPYNVASPHGSQTTLNDNQWQLIQGKGRDIRSRLEEIRMKRLSLQEYTDPINSPRQSQESLRATFAAQDRPKWRSSLRTLEKSYNTFELEKYVQCGVNLEPDSHSVESKLKKELDETGTGKEQQPPATALIESHRSISQHDIKAVMERKTHERYDPMSRSTSAGNIDVDLESSLKPLNSRSSGLSVQHSRVMQSLVEIPEETIRGSNTSTDKLVNSSESVKDKDGKDAMSRNEGTVPKSTSITSHVSAGPQCPAKESHNLVGKLTNSSGSATINDGKKESSKEEQPTPKVNSVISNAGSYSSVKTKGSTLTGQPQQEEPTFQRKNSTRSKEESPLQRKNSTRSNDESTFRRKNSLRAKVNSLLGGDERKAKQREEKSLQRKNSMRSKTPSSSSQPVSADVAQDPATTTGASPVAKPSTDEHKSMRGQSPKPSRSSHRLSSTPDGEQSKKKPLAQMDRSSPKRSSMRKTNLTADQDRGSRITLEHEESTPREAKRQQAYSRFEHLLNVDRNSSERSIQTAATYSSDKEGGSLMRGSGTLPDTSSQSYSKYPTQPAADNRLGRFMQRVGNLISKNK